MFVRLIVFAVHFMSDNFHYFEIVMCTLKIVCRVLFYFRKDLQADRERELETTHFSTNTVFFVGGVRLLLNPVNVRVKNTQN